MRGCQQQKLCSCARQPGCTGPTPVGMLQGCAVRGERDGEQEGLGGQQRCVGAAVLNVPSLEQEDLLDRRGQHQCGQHGRQQPHSALHQPERACWYGPPLHPQYHPTIPFLGLKALSSVGVGRWFVLGHPDPMCLFSASPHLLSCHPTSHVVMDGPRVLDVDGPLLCRTGH